MTHATSAGPHSIIPEIPGQLIPDHQAQGLRERVKDLCRLDHNRFPGSQPVSFGRGDIEKLKREDYWVCEKSDGVRVLVFILPNGNEQDVFLIDRHNKYRFVPGFVFPHYTDLSRPLRASILDGELVLDTDKSSGQQTLRLLIFDCLVIDEEHVMYKSLLSRTGRLKEFLFKPYEKMLRDFPRLAQGLPFEIRLKAMQLSYHLQQVLEVDIPRLMHGNDGLIYTCASSGYVVGTDPRIMKWKPPSENSIDFKLTLRFPPLPNSSKPDFRAKPIFVLNVWLGAKSSDSYEYFDTMAVDDEEWERMKASGEQLDDRIAEVVWTSEGAPEPRWKLLRFRDDKPHGNYIDVVESICRSIADGVEQADLVKHSQAIREAWKERERLGAGSTTAATNGVRPPQSSSKSQPPAYLPRPPFQNQIQASQPHPLPPIRYTGLGPSKWSRASGPLQINGINR